MCRAANYAAYHGTACSCESTSNSSRTHQLPPLPPEAAGLDPDCLPDSSVTDKQLERAVLKASSDLYQQMVSQGADLQRQLGNLYTASVYSGLAALISQQGDGLVGKQILCFSFGSGVVSSMFILRGRRQEQQTSEVQQQQQVGVVQQLPQQPCACEQIWRKQAWWQQPCGLQQIADKVGSSSVCSEDFRLQYALPASADLSREPGTDGSAVHDKVRRCCSSLSDNM